MIPKKLIPITPNWRLRNLFKHQAADSSTDPVLKSFHEEMRSPESGNDFLQLIRKFDTDIDSFIGIKPAE